MTPPYKIVTTQIPTWETFVRDLQTGLSSAPHESLAFVGTPILIHLPDVLLKDYFEVVEQLPPEAGWTMGRLCSYLVVQGVLRLIDRAEASR